MKNFELNNAEVTSLSFDEMNKVEGGSWLGHAAAFVAGVIVGLIW